MHFQKPPFEQAKLVRCIEGKVIDVAVDIRKGSPTFGKHVAIELSGENKRQLFVPRGFAHGFVVLSESAIFAYKVDNVYAPDYDSGIMWNDKDLKIDWGLKESEVKLSEKDKNLEVFANFDSPLLIIKMNILITGANGQLGTEIKDLKDKYTNQNLFFKDLPDLDICNYLQLEKFVIDKKINAIINCAAYTAVDKAEEDAKTTRKVNAEGF